MIALVGLSIQEHHPQLLLHLLSTTAFPAEHPRMARARARLLGGTLCPPFPSSPPHGSEALLPTRLLLKSAKDTRTTGSWTLKFLLFCTLNAGLKPGSVLLNHLHAQTIISGTEPLKGPYFWLVQIGTGTLERERRGEDLSCCSREGASSHAGVQRANTEEKSPKRVNFKNSAEGGYLHSLTCCLPTHCPDQKI